MTGALSLQVAGDGVGTLTLDLPGESVNTLRRDLVGEFDAMVDRVLAESSLRALVLVSGKSEDFIAGADLELVRALASADEGEALSRLMQDVTKRIEELSVPTVAAIHGACLGGGLELALAFDARIATNHPRTRLGLPEVQLGLLPGGGGTQRLPPLVGLASALDLLLTGRRLDATRAHALGLVDATCGADEVRERAHELARRLATGGRRVRRRICPRPLDRPLGRVGLAHRLMAGNPLGRRLVFSQVRARTLQRTRGLYPAPERILEVVHEGLASGRAAGLAAEARAFGALAVSPESRELVNLFFASAALKKDTGADVPDVQPHPVECVGVVGAGLMGAGIATVSVQRAGVPVVLQDRDPATAAKGREHVVAALAERVRRGRLEPAARDALLAGVRASVDAADLAGCQLVIEAVYEDLDLKRRVLARVEAAAGPEAIFASNTSAIPVARIAAGAARPARVAGMHYFSPVERMPLLEVVAAPCTSPATVATCVAFGQRQGKTVVVVRDGPGFYTTRILAPYMNEAARLVSEGVPVETVDEALLDFGFPLGPLALLDEVGIDVGAKVSATLGESFGERMRPPEALAGIAADGRQGRKNGRGFYRYDGPGGRRAGADPAVAGMLGAASGPSPSAHDLAERCVLLMVDEAIRCFAGGILRSARDGDLAAVFGLGFPPFLGGPFRYADRLGAAGLARRLATLTARHGPRFEPAPLLAEMAAQGLAFHRGERVRPVIPDDYEGEGST